jgi:hypothetical protein
MRQNHAAFSFAIAWTPHTELVFSCYANKRQSDHGARRRRAGHAGNRRRGRAMTAPAWVTWAFTVLVILLAVGSSARLLVARLRRQRVAADVDMVHALMGIAMAGMLMPRLSVLPGDVWLAVFAAGTAWFTWQAVGPRQRAQAGVRGQANAGHGHPAPHAMECLAMVYMQLAAGSLGSARQHAMAMPGMTAAAGASLGAVASNPMLALLALLLCVVMLGSALWTIDKLTAASARRLGSRDQSASAPRLVSYSKIGMSLAMGYMLLTML